MLNTPYSADEIIALLGKESADSSVVQLLDSFGIDHQPELDKDDEDSVTDWIAAYKSGIEFGFETEGALRGETGSTKQSGPFIFYSVIFYITSQDMGSYQGQLFHNISKSDSRENVLKNLSKYQSALKSYIRDVWDLPEYMLSILYTPQGSGICNITCAIRPFPYNRPLQILPVIPTIDTIINCFGMPAQSNDFLDLFKEFNIVDYRDTIFENYEADMRKEYGFECYFCPGTDIGLEQKRLVFSGIKFYRDRDLDAREWAGELPFGLTFNDDQNKFLRKIGINPDKQIDDDLDGFALWHFENYSMHVYYSNLENRIYRVFVMAQGYWQSLD